MLKKLPPISERQKEWAKEHCFKPKGYKLKDKVWCNCCGRMFSADMPPLGVSLKVYDKFMCPHCGKMIDIENSRASKKEEKALMTIVTTCGGWQVLRHVEVMKYMYKVLVGVNMDHIHYAMCEVLQEWINEKGEREIVARSINAFCYREAFEWTSKLSLKKERYDRQYLYAIEGNIYPIKRILPIIRRNGFKYFDDMKSTLSTLFIGLLTNPKLETMMKSKQYALADYCMGKYVDNIWPSIKIVIRNRYMVREPALWTDMVKAMNELGADSRNRQYVCPQDLRAEHDKWMKALNRKRERERREADQRKLEAEIEKAKAWEQRYKEEKERYFGVVIEGNGIIVTPIPSVEAMREEGAAMHHCVFTNGYYKKPDSLILSARDQEGKRVETIEVNLTVLKIAQCYGACNQLTERHQEIIDLMEANMGEIARRRNQRIEQEYGCAI